MYTELVIRFRLRDFITQNELDNFNGEDDGISLLEFSEMFRNEHTLIGLCDPEYEIVSVGLRQGE